VEPPSHKSDSKKSEIISINESVTEYENSQVTNENLTTMILQNISNNQILCNSFLNSTFDDTTSPTTTNQFSSINSPVFSNTSSHIIGVTSPIVISPPKKSNFLKIKYEAFHQNLHSMYSISKKIFLINLRKTLSTCHKYITLSPNKKIKFKAIFNDINNYSLELSEMLQSDKKEYMMPLYQILSNNCEIKISKFMENIYLNTKSGSNKIIHDKFEILEELSKDRDNQWAIYKCYSKIDITSNSPRSNGSEKKRKSSVASGNSSGIEPNCVIKIVDKKSLPSLFKASHHQHELNILHKMQNKYIMKTKEILSSNLYDYHIMEYIDCSLQDFIQHNLGLKMEEIWKLFRNLISAVDFCNL
jgi:hypothetical protein